MRSARQLRAIFAKLAAMRGLRAQTRAYVKPEDIEPFKSGWAGDPLRYTYKERRGVIFKGMPVQKSELPAVLYHVTTALPAVMKSGYLRAHTGTDKAGLGGGGNEPAVSFTASRRDAQLIRRELGRMHELSKTKLDMKSILEKFADEDARLTGADRKGLQAAIETVMNNYEVNVSSVRSWDDYQQRKENLERSSMFDAYKFYLIMRERHGAPKNPIIFGDWKSFSKMNPKNIGVVAVRTKHLPDDALFSKGPDEFLSEYRVWSDIPFKSKGVRFISSTLPKSSSSIHKLFGILHKRRAA